MNDQDRLNLAKLWGKIMSYDFQQLLGNALFVRKECDGDNFAQPGFVGKRFNPGTGIVFITRYPGHGDDGHGPIDECLYPLLMAMQNAESDEEKLEAFDNLTNHMPMIWKHPDSHIWRDFIGPVCEGLGIDIDDVAVIRVCPRRVVINDDADSGELLHACWDKVSWETMRFLKPGRVVILSSGLDDVVGPWFRSRQIRADKIRMMIGGKPGADTAGDILAAIR